MSGRMNYARNARRQKGSNRGGWIPLYVSRQALNETVPGKYVTPPTESQERDVEPLLDELAAQRADSDQFIRDMMAIKDE